MSTTTPASSSLLGAFRTRGFGRLLWTELKIWARGADLFWALLFPTVLLGGQAALAPELRELATGDTWAGTPFYGVSVINVILPAMLTMPMGMTALAIMPVHFGGFREKGVLRRFSATPMRPQSLFAVHFIINVAMSLAGALLALIVMSALFHIAVPNNAATLLLGFVLGMAAVMAIGSVIAAWAPKASAATAVGNIVFFPLIITAGVFTVIRPGTTLYQIARISPLGASSQVMSYGWFGGDSFPWIQVVVMIAWTVVFTPIAVKLFKWH